MLAVIAKVLFKEVVFYLHAMMEQAQSTSIPCKSSCQRCVFVYTSCCVDSDPFAPTQGSKPAFYTKFDHNTTRAVPSPKMVSGFCVRVTDHIP